MSKYTTELRFICQAYSKSSKVSEIISDARAHIFDFDYPIFDEQYREVLETKILKHFYMREIGAETVGLWKLWLDERLNLIMPYYNQLYESTKLVITPLKNYSFDKTHKDSGGTETNISNDESKIGNNSVSETNTETEKGKNESSTSIGNTVQNNTVSVEQSTDESINKFSDTPQGSLSGVTSGEYLTSATVDNTTSRGTNTSENKQVTTEQQGRTETNSKDNTFTKTHSGTYSDSSTNATKNNFTTTLQYIENVSGITGTSESKLLEEYRKTFVNIDEMIINKLNDLFMLIW